MAIEVLRPGVLTTVQDLGRSGQQRFGVRACGAMDPVAHRIGNALVGNDQAAASLEITVAGPTLRADRELVLALTGADCGAKVGVVTVPCYRPFLLPAHAELHIGSARQGARAYLSVRGGIDVPTLWGSRSTDLRSKFGGVDGRALRRGDNLSVASSVPRTWPWMRSGICSWAPWFVRDPLRPYTQPARARFVPGRRWEEFAVHSRQLFVTQNYRVDAESDRMGYRLQGVALRKDFAEDKLSEPVACGSIQIPPDGLPIILMADRQTVGGYPCVGDVAASDLARVAQLKPGDEIRFEPVTRADSERLWLRHRAELAQLEDSIRGRWAE